MPSARNKCCLGTRDVDRSEALPSDVVELELRFAAGRLFGDDPLVVERDHATGECLGCLGFEVDDHRLECGGNGDCDVSSAGVDKDVGREDQWAVEICGGGDTQCGAVACVDDRHVATGLGPRHCDGWVVRRDSQGFVEPGAALSFGAVAEISLGDPAFVGHGDENVASHQ